MKEKDEGFIKLAAAVITQAINDLRYIGHKCKELDAIGCEARAFLTSHAFNEWCVALGLNVDYMKRKNK